MNNTNNKTKSLLLDFMMEEISGKKLSADLIKELAYFKKEKNDRILIYVGAGTCGLGAGANKVIKAAEKYIETKKINAQIIETGCIGLCSSEPLLDVKLPGQNRISFEKVQAPQIEDILNRALNLETPKAEVLGQFQTGDNRKYPDIPLIEEHPFFKAQTRLVLKNCGIIDPISIEEYIAKGGYKSFVKTINQFKPIAVCNKIEQSGLRGRGGGGFPAGKKWKFAQANESDQKYLICNADEGDPGAFMDRAVIEGDPHRLLEGMAIAAYGIGATKAYVYIRAEYPLAIERLKIALDQAREYGLLGKNIFDTGLDFDIKVKVGAGAFVCGEETALIHSIEGKRGMPRPRPPFPAASGLFGKPTIINNVETLANIPSIIEKGENWYNSIGTEKSKGTKVFALSGKIELTGLVEIPMGTTVREIIFDIAGGIPDNKKFKSVQIGGPSGGCITEENLDIQVDYDSLLEVGAMMGSGGLVVMDEETCMVDVAKFFMDFIQRESCGKCIPCREGTKRMLEILESITGNPNAHGKHAALERMNGVIQLEKLGRVIKDTSLCGLGQTAPNPVMSTLKWFRHEYEEHIFDRTCSAGVCTELRTFTIDVEKCTGCTICAKKCPTDAIIGAKKTAHFVVEDKCISCGTCVDVCKFDAVIVT
ncbi:MAG: NADH-ubiquinone oxidoreductase-F iron-sulfur binding region domain-containing protein [Bacteroidota bacterium]